MQFVLVNHSKDARVKADDLHKIADALEAQLFEHYAPFSQSAGASVKFGDKYVLTPDTCPVHIFDSPEEDGYLGYHDFQKGKFVGFVFTKPIFESGGQVLSGPNSLSVTLSHEVLEALGDPYCNWWADIDENTQEAYELCDRVEGDSYEIRGVSVSNFLGTRAFREGSGPYDFMNLLTSPWDLRPGGYAIRRDLKSGEVYNVWGHKFPDWKKAQKAKSRRLHHRKHHEKK